MKPIVKVNVFVSLCSVWSAFAWADLKSSVPTAVQLYVSPQKGWSGSTAKEPPVVTFSGFPDGDHGRFLTIATGPEFINLLSGRSASFTGQLAEDKCRIEDPYPGIVQNDWASKLSLYQTHTRQIHSCVQVRVHDTAGLQPAPEQDTCRVVSVNEREAIASGGVCHFKVSSGSNFRLTYEVSPDCQMTPNTSNMQEPSADIFAFSGFYVSGDATGRSVNLKPIGRTLLRFTVEPSDPGVRLSTDMGVGSPRWPVVAYPDVHMGMFDIYQRDNEQRAVLNTQLFVENACTGFDKSECNFAFPLGMQFSLREQRPNGGFTLVDQWYSGGIAPARWQGFVPASRELSFSSFQVGRRYQIEADLTYLSIYHRLFKEGFRNYLISLGLWTIDPDQPLVPLRPIAPSPSLKAFSPSAPLPDLQPLTAGGVNDVSLELNRLRSLLTDVTWPPYYEKMCGQEHCIHALEGEARLKVGVEFTVDAIVDGKAKTSQYRVWRTSAYLPDYQLTPSAIMRPACE